MSIKGVYTALSGSIAQSTKLDTIANNIANVNTPAFKRDDVIFQEFLTAHEKEPGVIQVPKIPASMESFYDMQGGDKSYVDTKGTFTDFSQGGMKHTGNNFDLAIDGQGFFEIATPGGIKLTRAGNFTLDGNGQLVTKEGFPVLKSGGTVTEGASDGNPADRVIKMVATQPLSITDTGDLMQGETSLGKISVVKVNNADSLQKVGNSMYAFKKNMKAEIEVVNTPSLKQGYLENSNINIVKEMTDMIQTHRVFESTQKAINAYDQMADKLVNVVGKTTL